MSTADSTPSVGVDPIQPMMEEFWAAKVNGEATKAVSGSQARSGMHMVPVMRFVEAIVMRAGLPLSSILPGNFILPGYFRRGKNWDVIVVHKNTLVAAIELKSHVGSEGNNQNNRIEEMIGSAADIEHAVAADVSFGSDTLAPWLGYVMVFGETPETVKPVRDRGAPAFALDPAFKGSTYGQRYREALSRAVQRKVYDAAWFVTTSVTDDHGVRYTEPDRALGHEAFAEALTGRIRTVLAVTDGRSSAI